MPFFDFHIHTHFSSCCKQDYGYQEVARHAAAIGLDGFGLSDHSYYTKRDLDVIIAHKKEQQSLNMENQGLVGLEISIFNKKGSLGVYQKALPLLDYKILAEHVHVAKIFSGFFTFKKKFIYLMQNYPANQPKIKKMLDQILEMQLNAIQRHPKSILAHLFRFPTTHGYFFHDLYEMMDEVLSALQSAESVLELHSNFVNGINLTLEEANTRKKGGDKGISPLDYYKELSHRIKQYSIQFSLGSDAHRLENMHSKEEWTKFLEKIAVPEKSVITSNFFLNK
jgi:histidinol phosphatase-like PHP family hydrolase